MDCNADGRRGLDIGPDSVKTFIDALETTKTDIWNGPMGVFDKFAAGTECLHQIYHLIRKYFVSRTASILFDGFWKRVFRGGWVQGGGRGIRLWCAISLKYNFWGQIWCGLG